MPVKPVYNYEEIPGFAEQIATVVAVESSETATIERALSKRRKGQIYVDHMQNARGKSVVARLCLTEAFCPTEITLAQRLFARQD